VKSCSLGIWNESIPGFRLDEHGVSNYARIQQNLMKDFPVGVEAARKWENILKEIRLHGKGKRYDCIIGVSGGTDSSYLLHLAKQWGLRPLAVNLDNGWSSEIAVKNIKAMTNALGIDLETYVVDYEEMKDILRAFMRAGLPWVDNPTDQAIKSILLRYARREGIKSVLLGTDFRSEGKQPTEWTYGDYRQLKYIHKQYGNGVRKSYPANSLWNMVYSGYLRRIKLYAPFNFVAYNKQNAQQFLERNYAWQYYGEHHHENVFTKWVIGYWMYAKFGIDKRIITYSAQVLNGIITRDEALRICSQQPYKSDMIGRDTEFVLKKLDISTREFESIWNAPCRSFADYPSWYFLIRKFARFVMPLSKLVLSAKPKLFYEMEQR
jgi:N-acetyl sugar amidotransferase